jgi:hypothetical protein
LDLVLDGRAAVRHVPRVVGRVGRVRGAVHIGAERVPIGEIGHQRIVVKVLPAADVFPETEGDNQIAFGAYHLDRRAPSGSGGLTDIRLETDQNDMTEHGTGALV